MLEVKMSFAFGFENDEGTKAKEFIAALEREALAVYTRCGGDLAGFSGSGLDIMTCTELPDEWPVDGPCNLPHDCKEEGCRS